MSMTLCQSKAIPSLLDGNSAAVNAPTGSGKTLVYIIAVLTKIINSPTHKRPAALILVPNKELTNQVATQFLHLMKYIKDIKVFNLHSTPASMEELQMLKYKVDILVTTPATLVKCLRKIDLDLSQTSCVVVDEADMMVEYGHKQ